MNHDMRANISYLVFLVFLGYFLILIAYYFFLGIVGFVEGKKWSRKKKEEDYALSYFTSFALPVTIIVPAHNEKLWIEDCVRSVLNLNYPKFELIIVDDGSTDETFGILDTMLDLRPADVVYARHFKDGKTYNIMKSAKYPNVTVVHKASGAKKAGAMNAGLNIARFDYVCAIDADTVLEQDSLLKVMTEIQKDPQRIIGIGSYFGLSNYFKVKDGVILRKNFSYHPIIAYQNLEYIRSFFGNRIGWSRFNAMPIVAGGFGVWRRDVVYELGGYSSEFTCEDLEFTFRAHKYITDKKRGHRIVMLPYYVAWTDGPSDIPSLLLQRDRWQRVEIETVWKYRSMLFNPGYGAFGFLTFPYFLMYEVLGVFFEAASLAFVITGWALHILDVKAFLAFLVLMLASQAIMSLFALLSFIRTLKIFSVGYIMYLAFLGIIEFLFYRWVISVAKISGTVNYFRGVKLYDQYKRKERP
ncbi:MAG: glycosyltransferase [Candidatus Omnitrophota bacterium]